MSKCFTVALIPITAMFAVVNAFPQQPASTRYLTVLSVKVAPDKQAAFIDFYKTGAGAKAARARMKDNPDFLRYAVLQAVYPGDPAPAANFILGSTTNKPPAEPDPGKRDEMYRAAVGMNYADYITKVRTMSEPVGSTLSHLHDTTAGYTVSEGDYLVIRRLKTSQNKTQEVNAMMRDTRLPLNDERVKGGAIKGWSFSHLTFPTGTALPYNATEVTVFKDLASAVAGSGGGGNGAMASFAKLFPTKSYTGYVDSSRDDIRVVRTELYRVVAAYRQ